MSHRDQALLSGDALHQYYDDVLARLPDRGERFPLPPDEVAARRATHQLLLFPK